MFFAFLRSPENSIAFGSAPRREVDSQPISQLDRPAVSQTETHTLGFLSVADTGPSSGEDTGAQDRQWPNGNAASRSFWVGGSNPGSANTAVPPPAFAYQDSNRRPLNLRPDALPFDQE